MNKIYIKRPQKNPPRFNHNHDRDRPRYCSTGYHGHLHHCHCAFPVPMLCICCAFALVDLVMLRLYFGFASYVIFRITVTIHLPLFHNADTILLESAASNDQNNDEIECVAANIKRRVHEGSSDDDIDTNPNKKSASSSPASKRTGTHVSREKGREDQPKISSFPSIPRTGDRRANRRSLSHIRPPSITSGGSSNNREKPKLPPNPKESHVKTATLTKS